MRNGDTIFKEMKNKKKKANEEREKRRKVTKRKRNTTKNFKPIQSSHSTL